MTFARIYTRLIFGKSNDAAGSFCPENQTDPES